MVATSLLFFTIFSKPRRTASGDHSPAHPRFYCSGTPTPGAHHFHEKGAGPGPFLLAQPTASLWGRGVSISGCSKINGSPAQWARRSAGWCSSSEPRLHSTRDGVEVTRWPGPATVPCCSSGSGKGERRGFEPSQELSAFLFYFLQ